MKLDASLEPNFDKHDGLIIAIVQDNKSRQVLMHGFINREAWEITKKTGEVCFYSTSRRELWKKGGTSGNILRFRAVFLDCDLDAVLFLVDVQGKGVVCHTGEFSCFFNALDYNQFNRPE